MATRAGYLLDTNVLSEFNKARPNGRVVQFIQSLPPEHTFVSVLSLGELRKGAALLSHRNQAKSQSMSTWIDHLESEYNTRVLDITRPITLLWGELSATRSRPAIDTLLAATAIFHKLIFVTRNTRDVQDTPVALLNPWQEPVL